MALAKYDIVKQRMEAAYETLQVKKTLIDYFSNIKIEEKL